MSFYQLNPPLGLYVSPSHPSLLLIGEMTAALHSAQDHFTLTDAGANCSLMVCSGAQETVNIITNYRKIGNLQEPAHVCTSPPLLSPVVHL